MITYLVSRQSVWKIVVGSMLALVLIIGLSLAIPSLSTASVHATDTMQKSPMDQVALGDEDVDVVKVIVIDGKVIMVTQSEKGVIIADVDLKSKNVPGMDKMTEPMAIGNQGAADIAKADLKVKELLDMGAMIGKVSPPFYFGMMNLETGELEKITETLVKVTIEGVEKQYVAYVGLAEGKVVKLVDYSGLKGSKFTQK